MVSNPFTDPNKVCNPSDSSGRSKKAIRPKIYSLSFTALTFELTL